MKVYAKGEHLYWVQDCTAHRKIEDLIICVVVDEAHISRRPHEYRVSWGEYYEDFGYTYGENLFRTMGEALVHRKIRVLDALDRLILERQALQDTEKIWTSFLQGEE